LLTRIENRQFIADDTLSFIKQINSALQLCEDQIVNQQLIIITDFQEDFIIKANFDLYIVLANNLFQNAIRHNYKGGTITIIVLKNRFVISNSGKKTPLDQEKVFRRFNKDDGIQDSIGLGLSIAKEMAETSNLQLEYAFEGGLHVFNVILLKN